MSTVVQSRPTPAVFVTDGLVDVQMDTQAERRRRRDPRASATFANVLSLDLGHRLRENISNGIVA